MSEAETNRKRPPGELEQQVLLALAACEGEAPVRWIFDTLVGYTARPLALPSIYPVLERLCQKGWARVRVAASAPGRGGKPRKFYALEPAGAEVLRALHARFQRLWNAASRHPLLDPTKRRLPSRGWRGHER